VSTYTVHIKIGTQSFTINSTDVYDPLDTVYWLEGLRLGWAVGGGDPAPAKPTATAGALRFITKDVANLSEAEIGTTAWVRILGPAGVLIASCAGRIADCSASPFRQDGVQWLAYDLVIVDYRADLAELMIALNFIGGNNLIETVIAAIAAAGGPTVTAPNYSDNFDPIVVPSGSAIAVLEDGLRQITPGITGIGEVGGRAVLTPKTTAGALTGMSTAGTAGSTIAVTWPPAEFIVSGGLLTLVFGASPPALMYGYPLGLVVSTSGVDETITYRQSKDKAPNTVTVTGSFGSVTETNKSADEPTIALALSSTLSSAGNARKMARLYLPQVDGNRWRVDQFTWYPTDAELTALPWPLTPDSETDTQACYNAQVVINGIDDKINPSGNSGFYAGTLDGAAVAVLDGQIVVELAVNHRLPLPAPSGGAFPAGITWDELETQVGTGVKWNVGAQKVDPSLSWYETRLARKA